MPIKNRDRGDIALSFKEVIHLQPTSVTPSKKGLDNSVYFINLNGEKTPRYVLKILESKEESQIQKSIELTHKMGKFSDLKFYTGSSDNPIHKSSRIDKKFIIMNFLEGREPDLCLDSDRKCFSEFVSRLHTSQTSTSISPIDLLQKELDTIDFYYSEEMLEKMKQNSSKKYKSWYSQRADLYRDTYDFIQSMKSEVIEKFSQKRFHTSLGISHGDLNTGNMIISTGDRIDFIDPDNMTEDGYQLLDIVNAVSKSDVIKDVSSTNSIFNHYQQETKLTEMEDDMIDFLLVASSLRASLSTDYYTKEIGSIPKISTDWVFDNARGVIDGLSQTINIVVERLKVNKFTKASNIEESVRNVFDYQDTSEQKLNVDVGQVPHSHK